MPALMRLSLVVVALSTLLASASFGLAQKNTAAPQYDTPGVFPGGTVTAQGLMTSPYSAPQKTDEVFVAGEGGDLDQYLFREDRPDGRMKFNIPIGRYYSPWIDKNAINDQGFLKNPEKLYNAHLLPPTSTLRLMVFDVDHEAFSVCPEVDHVFVNTKPVTITETSAPAVLTGGASAWSVWTISIPTALLIFPTAPGDGAGGRPEAKNQEIAIDINVDNKCKHPQKSNQSAWGMAVDWGSIEIESPIRPVVFAHGWTGNVYTFDAMARLLAQDGIPTAGQIDLAQGILTIPATAKLLATAVQTSTQMFGVDKVNIFAHSKGGIVAREAMRTRAAQTDYLITFGSPHHGVDIPWWLILKNCNFRPEQQQKPCRDAAEELSMDRMIKFNYGNDCVHWQSEFLPDVWVGCEPNYFRSPYVRYRTIVGGLGDVGAITATFPWDADTIPEPDTVHVDGEFVGGVYGPISYTHDQIKDKPKPYYCAISLIDESFPRVDSDQPLCENPSIRRVSSWAAPVAAAESEQTVATAGITLTAGVSQSIPVSIDTVSRARFTVYGAAGMTFTLVDPNGRTIDPTLATADANIDYAAGAYDSATGLWLYQYEVLSPVAGSWQQRLQSAVETPALVVTTVNGTIQLIYQADQTVYRPGAPMVIEAALHDGQALFTDASITGVMRQPDGAQVSLVFGDTGINGDTQAGDGIFSAQATAANVSGFARLALTATRGNIRRELPGSIAIAAQTARIKRVTGERTIDADGDGLFDQLLLDVEIDVLQAGHFELRAGLQDGSGSLISTAAYSSRLAGTPAWEPGVRTVTLSFDGDTIRKHGASGPYSLVNVELLDQTAETLPVDLNSALYTTRSYQPAQFEGPLIAWVRGEDSAVDTNGNGLFDQLNVSILASVVYPGTYSWNGRLVDRNGAEIGRATGSGPLDSRTPMTFVFDGKAIGQHRQDGPFILRDVAVHQTSGGQTALVFDDQYTTNAYSHLQFEVGVTRVYLPMTRR